jgi:hypothetical protein
MFLKKYCYFFFLASEGHDAAKKIAFFVIDSFHFCVNLFLWYEAEHYGSDAGRLQRR